MLTMNKKYLLGVLVATMVLSACDYQKNNTIVQKDLQAGNHYVYGVSPDSAAKQLKNKYTEKPENEERAAKIREKLFGAIAQGN